MDPSSPDLKRDLNPEAPWDDDDRMRVLYAPFRSRQLNPESWLAKDRFWVDLVKRYLTRTRRVTTSRTELESIFHREGARPHCLAEVLGRMVEAGDLSPIGRVRKTLTEKAAAAAGDGKTWTRFLADSAMSAGGFVWNRLFGGEDDDDDQQLISEDNLQYSCHRLLELMRQEGQKQQRVGKDCFMALSDVREIAFSSSMQLQEEELELCLMKLQGDRSLSLRMVSGTTVVKVSKCGKGGGRVKQFSESEANIIKIKNAAQDLARDAEEKEAAVKVLRSQVLEDLRNKSRSRAKFALRKAKRAEEQLEKTYRAMDNLDQILSSLEAAKDDAEVLSAYQAGLAAMRETARQGTDVEGVEDLLEDIRESVSKSDEITEALARVSLVDEDEESLEEELEALLKEPATEEVLLDNLPVAEKKIPTKGNRTKLPERRSIPISD